MGTDIPTVPTDRNENRASNATEAVGTQHAQALVSGTYPMMKIEIQEAGDRLILQIEGRLAGAYVPELENCWRQAQSKEPGRQISVDLKQVTCVDRAGKYLLQLMHRRGVRFLRAGLALQDILEQIVLEQKLEQKMEQPECHQ